jgi:acetyl esterase/lipase
VPIGYLISVLVAATACALARWPRPTHGPRATPAFNIETAANELPFLVLAWLVASTALAAVQGDLDTPIGWVALGLAAVTVGGLVGIIRRALAARTALDVALEPVVGPGAVRNVRPGALTVAMVLLAPLPVPSRRVVRVRDLAYGPAGDANRLDLYHRRDRPERAPAFVYFHPGGFFSGAKSRDARLLLDQLARRGWVCVSANYRLGADGRFPRAHVDAKLVLAWLREHAEDHRVNPDAVVVAGGSAGAHLAVMCALSAGDRLFQPGFEQADTSVLAAVGMYGYYGAVDSGGTQPTEPEAWAHADAPPMLVVHGERDPMVPAPSARRFAERLGGRSARPVVYAELSGGQHGFDRHASIRSAAVAVAVERFVEWARIRQ